MKALHSIFITFLAVALLVGCSKSAATNPDGVKTPMDNMMAMKQALQAFNTGEGHYPKTLDELAPKYIAKVPDAPSGFKYAYDPATGDLKVSR